jgi:hypothetical protein
VKRSVLVIGGVGALVLLLAGAAFLGGRLLSRGEGVDSAGLQGMPAIPSGDTDSDTVMVSMEMEKAEELPESPADVVGNFARREDNSIFVYDMGGSEVIVTDGSIESDKFTEIEVVVTSDTTVYEDVTQESFDGPPASGTYQVQQKVKSGSVDEIEDNSIVVVWGERRGDRVVAHVLVYQSMNWIQTGP